MQINEWGEENFINHLSQSFPHFNNVYGIGDDCAIIPWNDHLVQLITTDALVEDIHFQRNLITPFDLGYKAIAVNVSDIVAMGGKPSQALMTICFPKNLTVQWILELTKGMRSACKEYGVQLIGGDTTESKKDLFLNIVMMGYCPKNQVKYRKDAVKNDVICTTGTIGNSGLGLKALLENIELDSKLIQSHCHPQAHIKEGLWLSHFPQVHAMMDLSDGLICDLKRLMQASQCGANLELERLPLSQAFRAAVKQNNWDLFTQALEGGEDYCLLLTVDPNFYDSINKQFNEEFGHDLYRIGAITNEINKLNYTLIGKNQHLDIQSFQHFN